MPMRKDMTEIRSDPAPYCHDHVYLNGAEAANERRTWIVIALTAVTMVVEIVSGWIFGSMALLADGWHMASHTAALGITALAYGFSRRHADDPRFSFGTGKVGDLAGFASANLLAFIAVLMGYESVERFLAPVPIDFDEAIGVAVLGLGVNVLSAFILKERHEGRHGHRSEEGPGHPHHGDHHTDLNLKAAYLHVLADALISVLAIAALTAGRFLGWVWLDPMTGVVGAAVILRWSWKLMRQSGRVLLDMVPGIGLQARIREAVEAGGADRVVDLHLWRIGMGKFAAILSVLTQDLRSPDDYKALLCRFEEVCHVTVEVNRAAPAAEAIREDRP